MRLEKKEHLVAVDLARGDAELLVLTENGFGKRVPLNQFPLQGRNGKGLRVYKSGVALAGAWVGREDDHAFAHLARGGARSLRFAGAPRRSRAANGARLVETGTKDRVALVGGAVPRPTPPAPREARPKSKGKSKGRSKGKPARRAKGASTRAKRPGQKPRARTPKSRGKDSRTSRSAPRKPPAKKRR
jgi:DNA gyrase subunit A